MSEVKKELITGMRWNGNNLSNVIHYAGGLNHSVAHLSWEEYEKLVADSGLKIFTKNGGEMVNIGDLIVWIDDELKVLRTTGVATIKPDEGTEYKLSSLNDGNVSIHRLDIEGKLKLHAICYTAQELYEFIKDARQQFNAKVV